MDAPSELLETIEDGIATLTFNRPERMNALSTPIMDGLLHGLPRLAGDPAVKTVVLTGAGRAFCAGGHSPSALAHGSLPHSSRAAEADDRDDQRSGGGSRACSRSGLRSADRRGLGKAGDCLRQGRIFRRLRRQLFFDKAGWDRQSARTLFHRPPGRGRRGVNARSRQPRVPDDQLRDATMELARSLAQGPQIALSLMKCNMNCAENAGLAELLDIEAVHQVQTGRTEDHREAARAFVEKRTPVFTGR
jgi:2-(1,2-epoxy-1,2-dihydrophenyl)acetyl-CoA isomerase